MAARGVMAPKSYWEGRNVLVTGANGFLGSWVSQRLVEEGANVICFIRDTLPRSFLNLSGTTDKVVVAFGTLEDYLPGSRGNRPLREFLRPGRSEFQPGGSGNHPLSRP